MPSFTERLDDVIRARGSPACIGLDPDPALMAIQDVATFNRAIIDATVDLVAAYKLQLAFYEALGLAGLRALGETIDYVRYVAPGVLVIGDGKRGDIGSTAVAYARAMFEAWDFDAATVNVYQGFDALEPFLAYPGRGAFVVCRSSNPSSRDFQDQVVGPNGRSLFEAVADAAEGWDDHGAIGLVVGATVADELRGLRRAHPRMPFLIPGIGQQGGDVAAARAAADDRGRGILASSSRAILYASRDPEDYVLAARHAAMELHHALTKRPESPGGPGLGDPPAWS